MSNSLHLSLNAAEIYFQKYSFLAIKPDSEEAIKVIPFESLISLILSDFKQIKI